MESLQDVWLSYPVPCWWSTTSNRARQDRFLMVQARRHPFVNAIILRNELRNAVGVNMSTQTVRNHLRQSGLRSRRSRIRIPLTRLHKQVRLNWTQDHVNWTYKTIGILYYSPMRQNTVLTVQIDVLGCGEDVGSDLKMPTSPNITAMVDAPTWCGLVSAEVEEQTSTDWCSLQV